MCSGGFLLYPSSGPSRAVASLAVFPLDFALLCLLFIKYRSFLCSASLMTIALALMLIAAGGNVEHCRNLRLCPSFLSLWKSEEPESNCTNDIIRLFFSRFNSDRHSDLNIYYLLFHRETIVQPLSLRLHFLQVQAPRD